MWITMNEVLFCLEDNVMNDGVYAKGYSHICTHIWMN